MTFGRRGVRQTVGLPGTGFYATRQLSGSPPSTVSEPVSMSPPISAPLEASVPAAAVPVAIPSVVPPVAGDEIVLYFGFATAVGIIFGLALLVVGLPPSGALTGGAIAIVMGIVYEGLAHHHPGPAKAVVSVIVGLIAVATAVLGAVAIAVVGAALLGLGRRDASGS
jgi:hypothetical protein